MKSSQNENVVVIDSENEIGFHEWNIANEILNGYFQTKQNTTKETTKPKG
jgi:hypothetical protein